MTVAAAAAPDENAPPVLPVLKVDERRVPLRREEVPLPSGGDFSLDILLDERKAEVYLKFQIRKRIIMEEREILHKKCKENPEYRKLVYERCRRDARYFIDYFCWTYDDRVSVDMPFILYD